MTITKSGSTATTIFTTTTTILLLTITLFLLTAVHSTTLPISQFLDRADQLLINRLHSPIFTVKAPSISEREKDNNFFIGSVFITTYNATLSISTTHGGQLECMYYPDAHPLSPVQQQRTGGGKDKTIMSPIPIRVSPLMTQSEVFKQHQDYPGAGTEFGDDKSNNDHDHGPGTTTHANKGKSTLSFSHLNPTPSKSKDGNGRMMKQPWTSGFMSGNGQSGIYDQGFMSSSSRFYHYLTPHEIDEMISDPEFDHEPLPWDVLDFTLVPVKGTMRRDIILQFSIPLTTKTDPATLKLLKEIQPHTVGFIQCKDVMIGSDVKSLRNQMVIHSMGYDRTHYAVIHSSHFAITHNNVQFNESEYRNQVWI